MALKTSSKEINTNILQLFTVKGFSPSSRLMMRRFHTAVSLRHLVVDICIVVKRAAISSCFITYYYKNCSVKGICSGFMKHFFPFLCSSCLVFTLDDGVIDSFVIQAFFSHIALTFLK